MNTSISERTTAKDRAISCKTLVCFLQSLVGQIVVIELKNDSLIKGKLIQVDAYMNCTLGASQPDCSESFNSSKSSSNCSNSVEVSTPVTLLSDKYTVTNYESFFVKGTRIRYVEVPGNVDPIAAIKGQLSEHRRVIRSRAVGQPQIKRSRIE